MKKSFILMLIIAFVCSTAMFAATPVAGAKGEISSEGDVGTPNKESILKIGWEYNPNQETYEVGFAADVADLSGEVNNATSLSLSTNNDGHSSITGSAKTNVYWKIYSNHPFVIKMAANGPLVVGENNPATTTNNLINWTASWTTVEVDGNGEMKTVQSDGLKTLGNTDDSTYKKTTTYTDPLVVFTQAAGNYPSMRKSGSAEVTIATENTFGSEKINGNYAAQLKLTVSAT